MRLTITLFNPEFNLSTFRGSAKGVTAAIRDGRVIAVAYAGEEAHRLTEPRSCRVT